MGLTEIINFCLNMELPILLGLLWIGASITANPVYHRPQFVWQPTTWPQQYSRPTVPVLYQPVHHAHAISQQNNYGMRRGRSEVHNNLLSYGSPLIRSVQSPTISSNTSKSAQTNFTRTFGSAGQP